MGIDNELGFLLTFPISCSRTRINFPSNFCHLHLSKSVIDNVK